jgi:hypothetical protein
MGSCQSNKMYVDNYGNAKTNNFVEYPALRDSGNSFENKSMQNIR